MTIYNNLKVTKFTEIVVPANNETLQAISKSIQNLSPDMATQLAGSLGELIKAAGFAVGRSRL